MATAARRSLGKDSIKFRTDETMRRGSTKADVAMSLPALLRWGVPSDTRPRPSAVLLNFGWHCTGSEPWPVEEVAGLAFAEELRDTHLIWRRTTQVTPCRSNASAQQCGPDAHDDPRSHVEFSETAAHDLQPPGSDSWRQTNLTGPITRRLLTNFS